MSQFEKLSSFMDGETEQSSASVSAAEILEDSESRQRWQDWHLIGDVMRSNSLATKSSVANKIAQQLEFEPIHFPRATAVKKPVARRPRLVYGSAIAAAIAFVAVIAVAPQMQQTGITGLIAGQFGGGAAMTAKLDQPATPVMLEDPRLRDLLDAHGSMSIRPVSAEVR
ncbi:RseA family anti-sigma factor [beta proteobacterium MWH-UniP1]